MIAYIYIYFYMCIDILCVIMATSLCLSCWRSLWRNRTQPSNNDLANWRATCCSFSPTSWITSIGRLGKNGLWYYDVLMMIHNDYNNIDFFITLLFSNSSMISLRCFGVNIITLRGASLHVATRGVWDLKMRLGFSIAETMRPAKNQETWRSAGLWMKIWGQERFRVRIMLHQVSVRGSQRVRRCFKWPKAQADSEC